MRKPYLLLLFSFTWPADLRAQPSGSAADESAPLFAPLVAIGSSAEDSLRVQQLLGHAPTDGFLIRDPSLLTPPLSADRGRLRIQILSPELRTVWNSDLPFSLNEGNLWAGRGGGVLLRAGLRARYGRASLWLAPELAYHQNHGFQVIPYPLDDRSPFASPWHYGPESLDLPHRFGDAAFTTLALGQSSLSLEFGRAAIGLSTANQWWGPGIRNALVMSNNAPGIPHLFLRTDPIRARWGTIEAKWILGRLAESAYFDTIAANDLRSISALAVAYRPPGEPGLTLGLARAVYAPLESTIRLPGRSLHFLRNVGRPNARPASDPDREAGPDQIFSLFGRWVLPESGVETYVEWSRLEQPKSLRDLLVAPHHTQGYTFGLQWAAPVSASGAAVRLQAELTNVEQSHSFRYRRVNSYYTSRPVVQGYTHRGRVIGASIGPGASSQWVAADFLDSGWRLGVYGGRIRWDNDALFWIQIPPFIHDHDVSVFGGARAGIRLGRVALDGDVTYGERLNYLFQNPSYDLADPAGVDIRNLTLRLVVRPILAGAATR